MQYARNGETFDIVGLDGNPCDYLTYYCQTLEQKGNTDLLNRLIAASGIEYQSILQASNEPAQADEAAEEPAQADEAAEEPAQADEAPDKPEETTKKL